MTVSSPVHASTFLTSHNSAGAIASTSVFVQMMMADSSVCAIPVQKEQLAVTLHGTDSGRNLTLPQKTVPL